MLILNAETLEPDIQKFQIILVDEEIKNFAIIEWTFDQW